MRALSLKRQHINSSDLKLEFSTFRVPEALSGRTDDLSHLELWLKLAESYSERDLTVPTDRLPAISGLARRMKHPKLGNYHAGMWDWHIEKIVLWRTTPEAVAYSADTQFVAPSWSWASRRYPVYWMQDIFYRPDDYTTTSKVLSLNCTLAGPDPFGRVTGGMLQLKATCVPAYRLKDKTYYQGEYLLISASESHGSRRFKTESLILDLEGDEATTVQIIMAQTKIFKWQARDTSYCLVFCKAKKDNEIYERLGTTEVHTDWFADSEERVVSVM
jgi:hypothetical protein